MISRCPGAWRAGAGRWSPWLPLLPQALSGEETSHLILPVFAHPSFSSVYCIVRAVVWYTNGTLLSSTCRIWWFSFWDTMLRYFSFDECSLWFASLPKLSSDPYRNQDKVYNLAARKLGFNKFPSQSNVSTNEWLVGLGSPASFGTGCSWPE